MLTVKSLLAAVDCFLVRFGMSERAFGKGAANNYRLITRMRKARRVHDDHVQMIMRFILISEAETYCRREGITEDYLSAIIGDKKILSKIRLREVITPEIAQ